MLFLNFEQYVPAAVSFNFILRQEMLKKTGKKVLR
jgi:hypothetical protein